jgi:hypothetical protein
MSGMIYTSPTLKFPTETHLLKQQHLQNYEFSEPLAILKTHTGPRFTRGIKIPYVYDYVTELYRKEAKPYRLSDIHNKYKAWQNALGYLYKEHFTHKKS